MLEAVLVAEGLSVRDRDRYAASPYVLVYSGAGRPSSPVAGSAGRFIVGVLIECVGKSVVRANCAVEALGQLPVVGVSE